MRIMNTIAAIALLTPVLLRADDETTSLTMELVTMGRAVSVSVGVPTAFTQYRDVPQGLAFPALWIDASRDLRFFRFHASDAGERDQSVAVALGQLGRWRFTAEFDQWPYLHTTQAAAVHNYYGRGRLVIPDGAQMELESATDAEVPSAATRLVSEVGRRRLGTQRDRVRGRLDLQITENWSVRATGREEARNGQRPVSLGAFESLPDSGPAFALIGFEVPAAVEIRTSEMTLGTSFHRPRFGVDLDLFYSRFRNSITDILYDNPFRLTDAAAVEGGALNPLRAALGISADWPSNVVTSAVLSGYVGLAEQLHLATALGWSRARQEEFFASYTLNGAIAAPGFPAGFGPVNKETLPRAALDGRVTIMSLDNSLAWQLSPRATLRLEYRDLDTTDQTAELTFPGYAGSGDARWRTDFDGQAVTRPPLSLRSRGAGLEVDWRPVKPLTVRAEYRRDDRERGGRRGGSTEQELVAGRLIVRSAGGSSAVVSFEHSDRHPSSAAAVMPFDLAGRRRSTLRAQGEWIPRGQESFSVSASVSDSSSRYDRSSVLRDFDMRDATIALRWLIGGDATVTGEVTRSHVRHAQQWTEVPAARVWRRRTDDDLIDVALSYEDSFRAERFSVAMRAVGSFANQRMQTRAVDAPSVVDRDWPRVRNGLKDLAAGIEYAFSDRLRVGVQHIYEVYAIDDFAWASLSPYPLAALDDDTDARRLLFLDTHGEGYHAHQVGIYVRTTIR